MFQRAVRYESRLRLAFIGPSGSGKTYSALAVASHLAQDGRIALVDTEHGSASKYAGDPFDFDVLNLEPPFHPDRFIEAIHAAEEAGYEVVILDSLSHAWSGAGGLLELVDQFAARQKTTNTFAAWKDATPIHNRLIEAIVGSRIHVIVTMRSKTEYVIEQQLRDGKTVNVPRKIGMAPIQRDQFEYEFDVLLDLNMDNEAIVQKSRCPALTGQVIPRPGRELADTLLRWLSGEKPPEPPDWAQEARSATSLSHWTSAAYKLPGVANAFAGEQRLADWYGYVAGDFDDKRNGEVLEVLERYCSQVADGVKVKDAAAAARAGLNGAKAGDEEPALAEVGEPEPAKKTRRKK